MIKEAKKVNLVKLLVHEGYEMYFGNPSQISGKGYYFCPSFPGYRFMVTGSSYTDADDNTDDVINFVQKHFHHRNAYVAAKWILEHADSIDAIDLSAIPDKTRSRRWNPPQHGDGPWKNTYGFLLAQGLSKDFIDELRLDGEVFQDERDNIVFVVRDEYNKIIGHEILNWNYYKPPTALDGTRLTGIDIPSEIYNINPKNIVPPQRNREG